MERLFTREEVLFRVGGLVVAALLAALLPACSLKSPADFQAAKDTDSSSASNPNADQPISGDTALNTGSTDGSSSTTTYKIVSPQTGGANPGVGSSHPGSAVSQTNTAQSGVSSVSSTTASTTQADEGSGSSSSVGSTQSNDPSRGPASAPTAPSVVQAQFQSSVVTQYNSAPNYVLLSSDLQSLNSLGLLSADEQAVLSSLVSN